MKRYNYIIIKNNYPELEKETVLLSNNYKAKMKYAFINKQVHNDGTENINFIEYSNDLEEFQKRANQFVSWYNYPLGLSKNIEGYISELN